MERFYTTALEEHLKNYNQMLFLTGPRQVGKTTLSITLKSLFKKSYYFNWDLFEDRKKILAGQENIAKIALLDTMQDTIPIIIFDEIHKYSKWKIFLKGFFDLYKDQCKIVVTGSSRLDTYTKGGDSMMGRYFLYNIFPLTIAELLENHKIVTNGISYPQPISQASFDRLWAHGGFPEPFLRDNKTFTSRWKRLRNKQLFKEDIRSLSNIQEIDQLEVLAQSLQLQVGQLVNRSVLAKQIMVSVSTISRWLNTLKTFYHCFEIKPWTHNLKRTLLKEPKIYLYNWATLNDIGAKAENFVALHLYKYVNFQNDFGHGDFGLYFLRDKDKREVDFLITNDNLPWVMIEVKYSANSGISKSLYYFQEQTGAKHAFQVVFDLPYVDKDCFTYTKPIIVPAKTFLSQLI